jgi:hypothetical protein
MRQSGDSLLIGPQHLAQHLGIKLAAEFSRTGKIDEHHRELPALRLRRGDRRMRIGRMGVMERWCVARVTKSSDTLQHPASVADRDDAHVPEVLECQLWQHIGIN